MNRPTAMDLFAGAGGLSAGLMRAGYDVRLAIEWDHDAAESYRRNLGDHVIEADIQSIDAADLPDVDLIAGGPPCQGFSHAGKRDPNDPRNRLWREFMRIVDAKRPPFVLIENVRGMRSRGEEKAVLLGFADIGYHMTAFLLNAADYGVPQTRIRLFYVGNRIGAANPVPTPTHAKPPRHLLLGLEPWVTVRDALGDFIADDRPAATIRAGTHGVGGWSPKHPGGWIAYDPVDGLTAEAIDDAIERMGAPANTITAGGRRGRAGSRKHPGHFVPFDPILDSPAATIVANHGNGDYANRTIRPHHMIPNIPMDSPSQTITGGGTDAGGAEPVRHRLKNADGPGPHPGVMLRRLTVAECAVIQDFPPGFEFAGTQTSQYRQIGNAVPGGLATALGGAISAKLASY